MEGEGRGDATRRVSSVVREMLAAESRGWMGEAATHKADVLEQPRENPDTRFGDDESDDVEDETKDGHREEGSEEGEDSHGEVVDS